MCIALLTTAHPDYPLILINNRDEFLVRPTAPAAFWATPHTQALGGLDLQRPERGTWLGVTLSGRLAVLTNFRERGDAAVSGPKSRGALPKAWLSGDESAAEFSRALVEDAGVKDVGGFSLLFGELTRGMLGGGRGFAIVSNRTQDVGAVTWVCGSKGETLGLSNSWFGDRSWPKVVSGEESLEKAVLESKQSDLGKDGLVARLFDVLSEDTLPKRKQGDDWETYTHQLRNSIFIPRISGGEIQDERADGIASADQDQTVKVDGGAYGTQKQTVILVDRHGKVTFVEKTLYDEQGRALQDSKKEYEFDVEGWDD